VFLRLPYPKHNHFSNHIIPARLPLSAFHRELLPFVAKLMLPLDFGSIFNARRKGTWRQARQ